ncbi:hypothetical protein ACLOJK_037580 [Asimina triloba]
MHLSANPSSAMIMTVDPNPSKEHQKHPHSRSGNHYIISFKFDWRPAPTSAKCYRLTHHRESFDRPIQVDRKNGNEAMIKDLSSLNRSINSGHSKANNHMLAGCLLRH